jgi:hypothetical protein
LVLFDGDKIDCGRGINLARFGNDRWNDVFEGLDGSGAADDNVVGKVLSVSDDGVVVEQLLSSGAGVVDILGTSSAANDFVEVVAWGGVEDSSCSVGGDVDGKESSSSVDGDVDGMDASSVDNVIFEEDDIGNTVDSK